MTTPRGRGACSPSTVATLEEDGTAAGRGTARRADNAEVDQAYDRYRGDRHTLAEIGRQLRGQPGPQVTLTSQVAAAALAAWQRDEQEDQPTETPGQAALRDDAATLA